MMKYTADERQRDREMRRQAKRAREQQNHAQTLAAAAAAKRSLEEDLVVQYGVYESNPSIADNIKTSFHPVYDDTHLASFV
jgi:hypothetical protein